MSSIIEENDRQLIPRWRTFYETEKRQILGDVHHGKDSDFPDDFGIDEKIREWERSGGILRAAEVVQAAFLKGEESKAEPAAEYILSQDIDNFRGAHRLARKIIEGKTNSLKQRSLDNKVSTPAQKVSYLRRKIRRNPKDAIARVDLAHAHVLLGNNGPADRQISIALRLAPNNRFVLRSATRFLLHSDQHDKAHSTIRQASATENDPWLMSAEIATAAVLERNSGLVPEGKRLVGSDNLAPLHKAELASAIGTLEGQAGNDRSSRRFFHEALVDPTENTIAQAEWVTRNLTPVDIQDNHLQKPGTYEARARRKYHQGDLQGALKQARSWLKDQRFSKRAVNIASFIASTGLQKYDVATELLEDGLMTNPHDPLLKNNLAYSLAKQGRVEDARDILSRVNMSRASKKTEAAITATKGLIKFRDSNPEEGRPYYVQAVSIAKDTGDENVTSIAMLSHAVEEIINNSTCSDKVARKALDHSEAVDDAAVNKLRERLMDLSRRRDIVIK